MKEFLGIITVALSIIGHIPYILDIFKGKTKPHVFTWLIWSIVTTIAFIGQWTTGGGAGSWGTGMTVIITILITFLSFKYGSKDITTSDKFFFTGALISIIPWLITKDILLSVIIATLIDIFAYLPTIRKTLKNPETETLFTYIINVLRHGISITALQNYAITTYLYPSALLLMNIVMTMIIAPSRLHKQG